MSNFKILTIFILKTYYMKNEDLIGFERKIMEIINDPIKVKEILNLFPVGITMPLYYKGDVAELKDGNEVTVVKSGWKNGGHTYYFYDEDDNLVYCYEDDFL